MTREHKLSLLLAFAGVLVVGVLISDHLSGANQREFSPGDPAVDLDGRLALADSSSDLVLIGPDGRPIDEDAGLLAQDDLTGGVAPAPITEPAQSGAQWLGDQLVDTLRSLSVPPSAAQTVEEDRSIPTLDMSEKYREQLQQRSEPDLGGMPEFRLHRVRSGDSLWGLAQRYLGDGSRHPEISAINKDRIGAGGVLRVGASIRIPIQSDRAATSTPSVPPRRAVAGPTTGQRTYVVRKGDTLSEIAQELLGTVRRMDEILEANEGVLASPDDLRVGMTLKIPKR